MDKGNKGGSIRAFWTAAAAVAAADRALKIAAFRLPAEGVVLIPGVLRLHYAENRGIAFSLLSGQPRLLGLLSLAAIAGMLWVLRKKPIGAWPRFALALMLGGAAGNAVDRLALGFVPDMIETLFMRFAVFNLADAALTVGCALMLISLLFRPKDWPPNAGQREKARAGRNDR